MHRHLFLSNLCDAMRGRQPMPTPEPLIAARHSSLCSISVLISEALLSPVSLLRVSRKDKYGLPWEGAKRMSSLAVRSGCLKECPASFIRLILYHSLGRLLYKSIILTWSSQETLGATLSIHVYTLSSAFSSCLLSVRISVPYCNTLSTVAASRRRFSCSLSTNFHTFFMLLRAFQAQALLAFMPGYDEAIQGPFSISYLESSNLASHLASSSIPSNLLSFLSLFS